MNRVLVYSFTSAALAAAMMCAPGGVLYGSGANSKPSPETNSQLQMTGVTSDNVTRVQKFWLRAQKEEYKSPEELQAQNARELRKGRVYAKLIRGNPRVKAVALTFDDGPHPAYTLKILAILKKYKVKATFFVIGKMVEQYPDLVRAEDAAGDLVGNHTYYHVNLNHIPLDEIALEWQAGNDAVDAVLHKEMKYLQAAGRRL